LSAFDALRVEGDTTHPSPAPAGIPTFGEVFIAPSATTMPLEGPISLPA
jgi:hypothetical protein